MSYETENDEDDQSIFEILREYAKKRWLKMSSIKNHENIYLNIKKEVFFILLRGILTIPILILLISSQYYIIDVNYLADYLNGKQEFNIFYITAAIFNNLITIIITALWLIYVKFGLKKIIESIGD